MSGTSGATGTTGFSAGPTAAQANARLATAPSASAGGNTYLKPMMQMDEHTDWVNQLIYLENTEAVVSCSNDTTIKLWMLPFTGGNLLPELSAGEREIAELNAQRLAASSQASGATPLRVNSFYTIDSH